MTEAHATTSTFRALLPLLRYGRRYSGRALAALAALTVSAAATLVVPFALRRMIDFGFSKDAGGAIDAYFLAHGRRGPRHRPCSGDALLSRHDARRAGGRRPAPRRLRPSDGSRRRLLRSRAHRRARLAADRRHDADQVRLRLVGFAGAAQSLPARRGDGADGLHQPETVGAGCRRHTGHRRAADRLRPDRPRPFAARAGHARRRDRFRLRKPRRRPDDAGVRG